MTLDSLKALLASSTPGPWRALARQLQRELNELQKRVRAHAKERGRG